MTLEEIKDLLVFARANGITAIKVADFEAHILVQPLIQPQSEIPFGELPGEGADAIAANQAAFDRDLFIGSDKDKIV